MIIDADDPTKNVPTRAKALWASNWGWNSLPDNWTGAPSIWGSVTGDQRTSYTLAALDRADREWAWLGGMILRNWQPAAPPDDPQWGFALIDSQGSPTPLYTALVNRPVPAAANGLYFSQAIIWDKQHPVLTRKDYMGAHEWCFYGWREGAAHQFFGPNNVTDLWAIKKVSPQNMVHLTEKPVELAARAGAAR